jgi:acyl carrier protein
VNRDQALSLLKDALTEIVPDADFTAIGPDTAFRDALELDSLDFLNLVERLTENAGCRIDEDDYPRLATLNSATSFLVERT